MSLARNTTLNDLYYRIIYPKYFDFTRYGASKLYLKMQEVLRNRPEYSDNLRRYLKPEWSNQLKKLSLNNGVPSAFLEEPLARQTFFSGSENLSLFQKAIVTDNLKPFDRQVAKKLFEPRFGVSPFRFFSDSYLGVSHVSPNGIAMLYKAAMIKKILELPTVDSIAEFGSGYGLLASILIKLIDKPVTYLCIDVPEVLLYQYVFLSAIFGSEQVVLAESSIEKNKINLVPVYRLKELSNVDVDVFHSSFAITEASEECQDDVAKMRYLNARQLYLSGHFSIKDNWDSIERTVGHIKKQFSDVHQMAYPLPDCYQVFAKR